MTAILTKNNLTPKNPADLKTSLTAALANRIKPIFNIGDQLSGIQNSAFQLWLLVSMTQTDFAALSPQQLYEKLKGVTDYSKLPAGLRDAAKEAVGNFIKTYDDDTSALTEGSKSAQFAASSILAVDNDQQSAIVDDLKKYAGFDVGALYAYRVSELRSYAMVHIYLGPVSLKTSDLAPIDHERFSLAFGMALKDLSGASSSKVSAENAFVYGIGYRLNKYFRLTVGGMLYRTALPAANDTTSPANGTLRNELFIGPSIDVTALPALKSIFSASKSTN